MSWNYKFFINHSEFCIVGFSEQCLYACKSALASKDRVDILQLFFPSLHVYEILHEIKRKNIYIEIFIKDGSQIYNVDSLKKYGTIYIIKDN